MLCSLPYLAASNHLQSKPDNGRSEQLNTQAQAAKVGCWTPFKLMSHKEQVHTPCGQTMSHKEQVHLPCGQTLAYMKNAVGSTVAATGMHTRMEVRGFLRFTLLSIDQGCFACTHGRRHTCTITPGIL